MIAIRNLFFRKWSAINFQCFFYSLLVTRSQLFFNKKFHLCVVSDKLFANNSTVHYMEQSFFAKAQNFRSIRIASELCEILKSRSIIVAIPQRESRKIAILSRRSRFTFPSVCEHLCLGGKNNTVLTVGAGATIGEKRYSWHVAPEERRLPT